MTTRLNDDTSVEIEERQVEGWRSMTAAQGADLVASLWRASRKMALAGLRDRYPAATPRELFLRLAILTLGSELARRAYPEIEQRGLR